jgi:phosphoserine phosphatase
MIEEHKNTNAFAVFDADNTIWKDDLTEALLAYYDCKDVIRATDLSDDRLPVPATVGETLYGYYERLCKMDHSIGYLWSAQIFAGFTVGELASHVDAVMSGPDNYVVAVGSGLEVHDVAVPKPRIFPAQAQLIETLQSNGIAVWVVSASAEEVVRLVVSHPKYGINVTPERVIGVNFLLRDQTGGVTCGAIERKSDLKGLDHYFSKKRQQLIMTHHLFAPATWYGGKLAAIKEWIHPSQRPILAAGDSTNDQFMLFYVDTEIGGQRVFINRGEPHQGQYADLREERRNGARSSDPDPDANWLTVTAVDLGLD